MLWVCPPTLPTQQAQQAPEHFLVREERAVAGKAASKTQDHKGEGMVYPSPLWLPNSRP